MAAIWFTRPITAASPCGLAARASNAQTRQSSAIFSYRETTLAVVDIRGTGASFGTRGSFRSSSERDDTREIAEWIVA